MSLSNLAPEAGRRYSRRDDPGGEHETLEVESVTERGNADGKGRDVVGTIVFGDPKPERSPYACSHDVFPKAWGHDQGPVDGA